MPSWSKFQFCFSELSGIFLSSNTFDLWLVESENVEAADAEGQLYCLFEVAFGYHALLLLSHSVP